MACDTISFTSEINAINTKDVLVASDLITTVLKLQAQMQNGTLEC